MSSKCASYFLFLSILGFWKFWDFPRWLSYSLALKLMSEAFGNIHSSSRMDIMPIGWKTRQRKDDLDYNYLDMLSFWDDWVVAFTSAASSSTPGSRTWPNSGKLRVERARQPGSSSLWVSPFNSNCIATNILPVVLKWRFYIFLLLKTQIKRLLDEHFK